MNKIILAILLSGFGAQLLKIILFWFKHKCLSLHDIVVTGGMPSSHAAFVVSLATAIYLQEGATTFFAISLVLTFVVIIDAFNVRRSVGEEGMVIDQILHKIKLKTRMHYALGHTPLQVLVGALIGVIVALAVYIFF